MNVKTIFQKATALSICVAVLFSLLLTASASYSRTVNDENIELVPTVGAPGVFDIPKNEEVSAEELQSLVSQDERTSISPYIIPDPSNIFRINFLKVYPAVMVDGTIKYVDYYYNFTPASYARTTVNAQMTAEKQQVLIDYAESKGYTVVGWYLSGEFYMKCYVPHWVEYSVYNHETPNGGPTKAVVVNSHYASVSTVGLFPSDGSQDYTYGWDGIGRMSVYYPQSNYSEILYPPYTMKAHFTK